MLTRQQGLDPGPAWYQPSPARSLAVLSASFKTALHSLGAHRLRSTLTVLGIVIGIAAVIVMISVGNGAQEQIARQIRSLGANVIGISPGSIAMKSVRLGAGTASKLSEDDAAAIESEVSGILAVAPALYTRAQFTFGSTPIGLPRREFRSPTIGPAISARSPQPTLLPGTGALRRVGNLPGRTIAGPRMSSCWAKRSGESFSVSWTPST